jgi:hypothetical protein
LAVILIAALQRVRGGSFTYSTGQNYGTKYTLGQTFPAKIALLTQD